jgi:phosphonate transport system substrate-binding protein
MLNRMRWPMALALTLVMGLSVAACQPAAEEPAVTGDLGTEANPIVMSFVPSGETEEITAGSDEIRDLLEAETGLQFDTNIATSYAAVIEALGADNAHVAWLPTLSYILANEKFGVTPILVVGRYGSTSYASQIITRADSGITTLADLKGKSFCRPDALSTSGWVVPSVLLAAEGVQEADLSNVVDAGGHDGVVKAVYNGDCDAGATFVDARKDVEDELADVSTQIVVIGTSADIPNDNVSVTASLPPEIVEQIRTGLTALLASEAGAAALATVYGVETLEPADDTFYDGFRVTLDKAGVDVSGLINE